MGGYPKVAFSIIDADELQIDDNLQIEGFDLKKEQIHRYYNDQDHRRKVLIDPGTKQYYKIWHETYFRGKYFYKAFNAGYYEEDIVPALVGVIVQESICRGYVMEECKELSKTEKSEKKWVGKFLTPLIEKIHQTGYFYYDFADANIRAYEGKFCLIDLDSIYPFSDYEELKKGKHKGGKLIKNPFYEWILDREFKQFSSETESN